MKKVQLQDLQSKIDNVNERCRKMWQKLQVFQRNEKYGFQGFKALQALNPYLINDKDRIKKNEKYLLEVDDKAEQKERRRSVRQRSHSLNFDARNLHIQRA